MRSYDFSKRGNEPAYTTSRVCAFSAVVGSTTGETGAAESQRRDEISMFWVEFCRVTAGLENVVDEVPEEGTEEMGLSE